MRRKPNLENFGIQCNSLKAIVIVPPPLPKKGILLV